MIQMIFFSQLLTGCAPTIGYVEPYGEDVNEGTIEETTSPEEEVATQGVESSTWGVSSAKNVGGGIIDRKADEPEDQEEADEEEEVSEETGLEDTGTEPEEESLNPFLDLEEIVDAGHTDRESATDEVWVTGFILNAPVGLFVSDDCLEGGIGDGILGLCVLGSEDLEGPLLTVEAEDSFGEISVDLCDFEADATFAVDKSTIPKEVSAGDDACVYENHLGWYTANVILEVSIPEAAVSGFRLEELRTDRRD